MNQEKQKADKIISNTTEVELEKDVSVVQNNNIED